MQSILTHKQTQLLLFSAQITLSAFDIVQESDDMVLSMYLSLIVNDIKDINLVFECEPTMVIEKLRSVQNTWATDQCYVDSLIKETSISWSVKDGLLLLNKLIQTVASNERNL